MTTPKTNPFNPCTAATDPQWRWVTDDGVAYFVSPYEACADPEWCGVHYEHSQLSDAFPDDPRVQRRIARELRQEAEWLRQIQFTEEMKRKFDG